MITETDPALDRSLASPRHVIYKITQTIESVATQEHSYT